MSKNPTNGGRPPAPRRLGLVAQMVSNGATNMEQTASRNTEALIVPLERVRPNPNQPRRVFDEVRDQELAENIRQNGVLEPLIVREIGDGEYEIVAGERRYRASKLADKKTVPVIVKDYDDKQAQFISVVENLQRVDLDPHDEAVYFKYLIDNYNHSYRDIAAMVHRSPNYVGDRLKLLEKGAAASPGDDSEKDNKRGENGQKLQKSLTGDARNKPAPRYTIKPLATFDSWLNDTYHGLSKLKEDEKVELRGHLTDLRQKIARLEKELPDRTE